MTAPAINYWIKAEVTLRRFSDGSTKTMKFTNREAIGSGTEMLYPLILDISNLGIAMDAQGPSNVKGTLRLDDSLSSIGVERKFSDYLERYTFVDQYVEIFIGSNNLDADEPGSWTSIWKGKCTTGQRNSGAPATYQISMETRLFKRRYVQKRTNLTDWPNCPAQNLNKPLAIPIGSYAEVPAILVSAEGGTDSVDYAYATTLYSTHVSGLTDGNLYALSQHTNRYYPISSASNSTHFFEYNDGTITPGSRFAYNSRRAFRMPLTGSDNKLLIGVEILCDGYSGFGSSLNGQFEVSIWDHDDKLGTPGKQLGTALVDKSNYSAQINGAGTYWLSMAFDAPIPLTSDSAYYYLVTSETFQTGDVGRVAFPVRTSIGSPLTIFADDESDNGNVRKGRFWKSAGTNSIRFKLHGVNIADNLNSTTSPDGLQTNYLRLSQRAAPSYFVQPDLSKLNLMIKANGLSKGTISDSESVISSPYAVVRAMSRDFNGSAFVDSSDWDWSGSYSTMPIAYQRKCIGSPRALYLQEQFMKEICRQTGARIRQLANGKLQFWWWGNEESIVAYCGQDDCSIEEITWGDYSYVVNSVQIAHSQSLRDTDSKLNASFGISTDYRGLVVRNKDSDAEFAAIIGSSQALYDRRELTDPLFWMLGDDASALAMARFFCAVYGKPHCFVKLRFPWTTETTQYQALNVLSLTHPDLPAYFGSAPRISAHYEGADATDSIPFDVARAASYRVQIEARTIEFTPGAFPSITFLARLLWNYPTDPT